jgi:hypothetical protein
MRKRLAGHWSRYRGAIPLLFGTVMDIVRNGSSQHELDEADHQKQLGVAFLPPAFGARKKHLSQISFNATNHLIFLKNLYLTTSTSLNLIYFPFSVK